MGSDDFLASKFLSNVPLMSQKKVGFRMVPISPGASVEHLKEISMPKNRPIDFKVFLFILRGSKKIVKIFQTKIQPATWSKYTLKNTKNSKKSKILRFPLQ